MPLMKKQNDSSKRFSNLFSLGLLLGGSIGGIDAGVLREDDLEGTGDGTGAGVVRLDIDGLPVDAERTEVSSSILRVT